MATPSKLGAWAAGLDLQTAPADLLLSAFPLALAAPLIGQAVSALAAPEVEARLETADVQIETLSRFAARDLLFPVLSVRAVEERDDHDLVRAEIAILREGEPVQRITWTGRVADSASLPAGGDAPATAGDAATGSFQGVTSAVAAPLAAFVRALVHVSRQDAVGSPAGR